MRWKHAGLSALSVPLLAGTLIGCGRARVTPYANAHHAKVSFDVALPSLSAVTGVRIGGSPGQDQPVPRPVAQSKTTIVARQALTWLHHAQPVKVHLPSLASPVINGPSAYYYVVLERHHKAITVVPTTYYARAKNGGETLRYLSPIASYTNAAGHTVYLRAPRLDKWLRSTQWRSDIAHTSSK